MGTSQRVGRGFHRLGFFLAAIVMLVGGFISVMFVPDWDAPTSATYTIEKPTSWSERSKDGLSVANPERAILNVEGIARVRMFPGFENLPEVKQKEWADRVVQKNWWRKFLEPLAKALALTLCFSLVVYGVVRAIGWVIGGFAAS